MKLVPISLLVVPLLMVAAVGIVRAAPGKTHTGPAPVARDMDRGKDDSDEATDDSYQSMRNRGPGMGTRGCGMEMCGPGMGMRGPAMGMRGPCGGARGGMGARLLGPEGRLLRGAGPLAELLKLTGTQRDKLRDIGSELARKAIRARADLAVARLDLADALHKGSPSRQDVEERIDAITKLESGLMKDAVTARLDVREVLTSDQRKQLEDLRWNGPGMRERAGAAGAARGRAGAERGRRFQRP